MSSNYTSTHVYEYTLGHPSLANFQNEPLGLVARRYQLRIAIMCGVLAFLMGNLLKSCITAVSEEMVGWQETLIAGGI